MLLQSTTFGRSGCSPAEPYSSKRRKNEPTGSRCPGRSPSQNAEAKILYRNGFITDFKITRHNVAAIAASGRARWKIQNQKNKTLKKIGPHAKKL
jgi:hypothetical protein